jgi:uncharacterized protein YcfL
MGGCATQAPNSIVLHAEGGNPEITVRNEGLHSACEIVNGRVLYEGDILLGLVELRSDEDEKQQFHHRWRWYDADGVPIETGVGATMWQSMWVEALDTPTIQGRAPTPGAVTAEYQLRWVAERDD